MIRVRRIPRASVILRMLAFAVSAGLALAGIQPIVAAAAGSVEMRWAIGLTAPALAVAVLVFGVGLLSDRGDTLQPPWYSAWLLMPGSFLLAGAAAMCIFGALVQLAVIPLTLWGLLSTGALLWMGALVLVRTHSS